MTGVLVTRTYLELPLGERAADASEPRPVDGAQPLVVERRRPDAAEYRALYAAVGGAYHWRDRDRWSDARLEAQLGDPAVHVHVARSGDQTVGYVELRHDAAAAEVEIVYFGLVPAAHGRGLGRRLLEWAIAESGRLGARRVWLHTCSLDHPAALPNYRRRGFRVTREERYTLPHPDADHPPASRVSAAG